MTGVVPQERAIELTPVGVKIAGDVSREQLRDQALQMLYVANMAPLYAADLIIQMRDRFGDEAAVELIPAVGKTKHTVQNWVSVARAIPVDRRVDGLELGHYDAIRGIKDKEGNPLTGRQDQMIERAAREDWTVAETREAAAEARDRAQGKLIDIPDTGKDEPEDEAPVMDAGAFGEGLAAERADEGYGGVADGFDQISKIAGQIGRLTPDLRHRLWRMCINADDASVIHELFPQSPSHVEPEASPLTAPCEAPARCTPADHAPRPDPVGGGSLSGPGFDQEGEAVPPSYIKQKEAV